MLFFFCLVIRVLARLLIIGGQDDGAKDLEILVLRHELRVLQRTSGPPKLRFIDRVLLAAASRSIPRDRWSCFMVTPATLVRWHRELVRKKWTYGKKGHPGRPPIDPEARPRHPARRGPLLRLQMPAGRWPDRVGKRNRFGGSPPNLFSRQALGRRRS
jgi:hypothetical protein